MWCWHYHGNTREQCEEKFKQTVTEKGCMIIDKSTSNHDKILVQCQLGHQWEILPII